MKIKIILVGKTKKDYLRKGEQEYRKRLKRYVDLEWIVVKMARLILLEQIYRAFTIIRGEKYHK